MLTFTAGRWLAESDLPGTAFLTSAKFSSAGSDEKLGGNLPAAVHGPLIGRRGQPAVVVAEVEGLGRLVLEDIPVGVDRELEIVLA